MVTNRALGLHAHRLSTATCLVGQAGLEPAMPKAPDLQSGGVTNFPTDPYGIIKTPYIDMFGSLVH